jgi:putative flippase GtrA
MRNFKQGKGITHKHEALIKRLLSFLCIGGVGAIVNVICFTLSYHVLQPLVGAPIPYFGAFCLATELSLLTNFMLNDHFTFRRLRRFIGPWHARCLRFHTTCIGGVCLQNKSHPSGLACRAYPKNAAQPVVRAAL